MNIEIDFGGKLYLFRDVSEAKEAGFDVPVDDDATKDRRSDVDAPRCSITSSS